MRFSKGLRLRSLYQSYANNLIQNSHQTFLPKISSSHYCLCSKQSIQQSHYFTSYKPSYNNIHTTTYKFEKVETLNVPAFPDSVSEGDVRWIKNVGDAIDVDDIVCEIETDKTAVPVPSPIKGILSAQLVDEGAKVIAHQPLCKIETDMSTLPPPTTHKPKKAAEEPHKEHAPTSQTHDRDHGFSIEEVQAVEVPQFPESVSEGDVKWVKKIGDQVKVDDVICEIETDKTAVPVPSPFDGILQEQLFKDGDRVRSKELLCKIKLSSSKASPEPPPRIEEKKAASKIQEGVPSQGLEGVSPTPFAKSFTLSDETDIPSGVKQVPQFFPPPQQGGSFGARPNVPEPSSHSVQSHIGGTRTEIRVKMNRMRKRIAERLKEAQNTAAMLTTFNEIDMSTIIELRNKYKEQFAKKHGVKLGFMSPFVMAAVSALKDQPVVNGYISESSEIVYRDFIDISVAVSTPKGLVVPVIRSCEHMTCADIEKSINALGEKARKGNLAIEDMDGGTFTISNGGVFGSLYGTPIINLPQSAILGMHAIVDRPVAINNKVEIRPMMYVALTYDHRLIDGREAVLFLRKIKAAVEQPASILLDV